MSQLIPMLLLAQINKKVPKPGDWAFGWDRVALIALGAATVVFVAWLVLRFIASRERRISHSPRCLMNELCAAHALSARERQLIRRMAQQHRMEHPALLFLDPAWWDFDRLGPAWSKCHGELDRLRKRLFAPR
jgi:hypothetical protein